MINSVLEMCKHWLWVLQSAGSEFTMPETFNNLQGRKIAVVAADGGGNSRRRDDTKPSQNRLCTLSLAESPADGLPLIFLIKKISWLSAQGRASGNTSNIS